MGSYTTLLFGMKHPDRVRSLTLAGSGYGSGQNRQEFHKRVTEMAGKMMKEGMKGVSDSYTQGPTRVQLQNKNPGLGRNSAGSWRNIQPWARPTPCWECSGSGRP